MWWYILDILDILQYVEYKKYVAICYNIPNYILSIFELFLVIFCILFCMFFVILCIFFVIFCIFSGIFCIFSCIFSGIFCILKQIGQGSFCSAVPNLKALWADALMWFCNPQEAGSSSIRAATARSSVSGNRCWSRGTGRHCCWPALAPSWPLASMLSCHPSINEILWSSCKICRMWRYKMCRHCRVWKICWIC